MALDEKKHDDTLWDHIGTGDYTSCKKYLEWCETQDPAALSASINHIHCRLGTPIHGACDANHTAIVKLLLKYKADPNVVVRHSFEADLGGESSWNVTTMHLAAMHANLELVTLLIENGFNLHQMNICTDGGFTVFLILCNTGNIKCLDYIINLSDHGNKNNNNNNNPYVVDIFARDHEGKNGLNFAVENDDLEMCQYLLNSVYNQDSLRDRIINDDVFHAAAQRTGKNCVSIFKYLVENKQSIFNDMRLLKRILFNGALYSWQIVAYMIQDKQFHTKCPSTFEKMVQELLRGDLVALRRGRRKENYDKWMPLVWNFISMRLGDMDRLAYVAELVVSYFESFHFENDFDMFINMLTIMLSTDNIKDWKYFYKSTTVIPYQVCSQVSAKIVNKMQIDGRWKDLVKNMMIAYDDSKEWHKMSEIYNYSSDKNEMNIDKEFYYCTKHHVMIPFEHDEMNKQCNKCIRIKDKMGYWCKECNEYICCDCGDIFKLNQLLLNRKFSSFDMEMKKYNEDSPLLKQV